MFGFGVGFQALRRANLLFFGFTVARMSSHMPGDRLASRAQLERRFAPVSKTSLLRFCVGHNKAAEGAALIGGRTK